MEKRRATVSVATDLPGNPYPKLDASHRNRAGVETVQQSACETLGTPAIWRVVVTLPGSYPSTVRAMAATQVDVRRRC